jgi:ABC-type multidrug transport system fused ATPase/permease subunit
MKKRKLSHFQKGAKKIFRTHFMQETEEKKNSFLVLIVLGSTFSLLLFYPQIIKFLSNILSFLGGEVIKQNFPEVKITFWYIIAILFLVVLPFGIAIIMHRIRFKKPRYYMQNLRKEQREKGTSRGLESFLSQNTEFKKYSFLQDWLYFFKEGEEKKRNS